MQTVIGLFDTAQEAQKAVQQLKSQGFSSDNVDISVRNGDSSSEDTFGGSMDFNSTKNMTSTGTANTGSNSISSGSMTNDSMESGSMRSDSMSSDSMSNSGITGNSANTYGSSDHGNDDSFGEKVSRFFKNLFGNDDDDEANRYSHVAGKAGAVVTVHAQSNEEAKQAADILDEYGAVDVNERASEFGYSGSMGNSSDSMNTADLTNDSSDSMNTGTDYADDNDDSLKVIKENVQVGKKEVETGGVRLRSRIVERPVEEQLRLREEKVTVDRQPVDRIATTADLQNFKEGQVEMTERAEIAEVTKQARVVEEVKLSKDVTERVETVRDTARDTEVDVENLDKNDLSRKTGNKKSI